MALHIANLIIVRCPVAMAIDRNEVLQLLNPHPTTCIKAPAMAVHNKQGKIDQHCSNSLT